MKKTVIVNIPMSIQSQECVYQTDGFLPVLEKPVRYPVLAHLGATMHAEDEYQFLLVSKQSPYSIHEEAIQRFQEEFDKINTVGATASFTVIGSTFQETRDVHEHLLEDLIANVDDGSSIIVDITYGPKDLPIVEFAAFGFMEDFLDCTIEHIIYGQALYTAENTIVHTNICDMMPLYSLSSLTRSMKCRSADEARRVLHTILSFSSSKETED